MKLAMQKEHKFFMLFLISMMIISTLSAQQPAWRQANSTQGVRISDLEIYYSNPDTLYAFGYPSLLLSADKGENWDSVSQGLYNGVIETDPYDSKRIYLSHDILPFYGNKVLMSNDGGLNWISVFWGIGHPPWTDAPIVVIDPVDLTSVYVSVNYHKLYRSSDHWNTWDTIPPPNGNSLSSLEIAPSDNNILYAGFSVPTQVFRSTDRGISWIQMPFPLNEFSTIYLAIHPQNADAVYAAVFSYGGTSGGVYKSTDGGLTWEEKNNGLTNEDWDITTIVINPKKPDELYIGTGGNINLFKTTNGGDNWTRFDSGLPDSGHVSSIEIDTLNDRIYIGTSNGIYIYDTLISINNEILKYPLELQLYPNYPNPFNSATTISFHIPERENVKLKVYDILGKEIETLIDEKIDPGLHKIIYNASYLSTGIYFYTLQYAKYTCSKKLLYIK